MVSKKFLIKNKTGLHARPAGVLVKEVKAFESSVTLRYESKEFNAKSILGVMSACIKYNTEIEIICEGSDEQECLDTIEKIIESGLGE